MDGRDDNSNSSDAANSVQPGIFTPNPTTPPTPPAQTPVVTGSVVEPASNTTTTGLSHPYVSNHPTQTFSSETGDIVIGNSVPKGRKNKKILIMGIIITTVILLFVSIIFLICQNPSSRVLKLFKQNIDAVENVDQVLNGAFIGTLTTEELFSPQVQEMLNHDLPQLIKFSQDLDKIKTEQLPGANAELVSAIKNGLALRAQAYEPTLQLYNNLSEVLSQNDKDAILIDYKNSASDSLQFLANRFMDDKTDSFWQSTAIPQAVLSAYDDLFYYKPLAPSIKSVINELGK